MSINNFILKGNVRSELSKQSLITRSVGRCGTGLARKFQSQMSLSLVGQSRTGLP